MKKPKFIEAQILFAIKQSETGVKVEEACWKMGISEATFYNWKKVHRGMDVTELRKLRHLLLQLPELAADSILDKQMQQDVLRKNVLP